MKEIELLFRENHRLVYRAAYSVTANATDAEDILQDLFLNMVRQRNSPTVPRNPKGYLVRAAVNRAVSLVRSRKSRKLESVDTLEIAVPAHDHGCQEDIGRVRAAMAHLKPAFARILHLHYKEGYSCWEIAKICGKRVGTVVANLCHARRELKRLLRTRVPAPVLSRS